MKEVTDPNLLAKLNSGSQSQSGLKEVTDPSILALLNGQEQKSDEKPISKWEAVKKGAGAVKDFFAGDDTYEFGDVANYRAKLNVQGPKKGESTKDYMMRSAERMLDFDNTTNAVFGNDEDTEAHLRKTQPHLKWSKDPKNGRSIFTDPEDGKSYYVNNSSVGIKDVAKLGAQAYLYGKGGKLATAPSNLGARTLSQGTAQYGINSAVQKMSGRENIDQKEALIAGALGAGTEMLAPWAGKLYHAVKNKINGSSGSKQAGKTIADKFGLELADDELSALGAMRSKVDNAVPDDVLIAELEHGLKLSRGQATGNIRQLSKEQQLREQPALIEKFKQVDDFNTRQVEKNLRETRSKIYGNIDDELMPASTAEVAQDSLIQAEKSAKKAYKGAYKDVGKLFVKKEAAAGLGDRLKQAVGNKNQWLDEDLTPKSIKAIQEIEKSVANMGDSVSGFSLKAFDTQRKKINNLFSPSMDETDKRALSIVKNELDDWFYNSVDDGLLKGDKKALNQLKKARSLMTDYSKRFNSKDGVNKIITRIVQEQKTPEEFSQMLVGINGVNKASAGNLVKAYKNAVGSDSEGFKALKSHIFEKIILSKGGNIKGYEGLISSFNDAFRVKGKTLMKELFTQEEANSINSLMRSVSKLVTPKELSNPSQSGKYVARLAAEYGNKIPFLSGLFRTGKDTIGYANSRNLPLKSANIDTSGVIGTGQAVNN